MFTSVSFLPSDVTMNVPRYAFLNTSGEVEVKTSGPLNVSASGASGSLNLSCGFSVTFPAGSVVVAAEPSLTFHGPVEEIVTLSVFASSTRMLFTVVGPSTVPG